MPVQMPGVHPEHAVRTFRLVRPRAGYLTQSCCLLSLPQRDPNFEWSASPGFSFEKPTLIGRPDLIPQDSN